MKLFSICSLISLLVTFNGWSQDDELIKSDSTNFVLYADSSTFVLPGKFSHGAGCFYFDENDEVQTLKARNIIYVQSSPAVYLSLPFKNGGYCKVTLVWAYSDEYIMSYRKSVNGGYAYLKVYDMNFKLVESMFTIESEEGNANKIARTKAKNAKVIELLKKYFTCEELFLALDKNITKMIDDGSLVAPFKCGDDAELPIEKLRTADLKK
jgi:hypothetical protein